MLIICLICIFVNCANSLNFAEKDNNYGKTPLNTRENAVLHNFKLLFAKMKKPPVSHFIQICDFVSYFVNLYFKIQFRGEALPNRVSRVIDDKFVRSVMATLKSSGRLNLKANTKNTYGLVVYPK